MPTAFEGRETPDLIPAKPAAAAAAASVHPTCFGGHHF